MVVPSIYQHCGRFSLTKIIEDTTVGVASLIVELLQSVAEMAADPYVSTNTVVLCSV